MSKRSGKMRKTCQPAILRRKRKATPDLDVSLETSASSSKDNQLVPLIPDDNAIPARSCFTKTYGTDVLLAAHPLMRPNTLPDIPWAESNDVWESMVAKDIMSTHDAKMFDHHPELQPRMRAILLDWLIEVCEVYKLHRETFYLAQDCIDRYLATRSNVPKHQLQLLGIASLFLAAKVEEIYPPKVSEFAYVTDGACTEKEIFNKELVILMTLGWNLSPVTINSWLSVFLQVATFSKDNNENFEYQKFSGRAFGEICQFLDLCILDVGCLQFPYSVLAASAIAHLVSKEVALSVSGFKWRDIAQCVHWMTPFVEAVDEQGKVEPKFFQNVQQSDAHNIQTHNIGLKLLELAHFKQAQYVNSSPPQDTALGVLTPPQTIKKIKLK